MDLTETLIEKILNPALVSIAEPELTGVLDTATAATKCKTIYESVRDAELRERIWTCCKTGVLVTKDATDPDDPVWDYRYGIPTGAAYIIGLHEDEDFTIESGYILSNYTNEDDQVYVRYIQSADVSSGTAIDAEITRWDGGLRNVVIYRMGAFLATALKKRASSVERAFALYQEALDNAGLANAYEDRHDRHNRHDEDGSWIAGRFAE